MRIMMNNPKDRPASATVRRRAQADRTARPAGWLAALLLWTAMPALAEPALEIIELRFRTAEELVPVLRPLVGADAAVAGQGRNLFVRVPPAQLQDLRRAIARLDRPARQLLISVYQGRLSDAQLRELALSAHISISDDQGVSGQVRGQVRRSSTRSRLDASHQLRATEGAQAFIATGTARPLPQGGVAASPVGVYQTWGTGYLNSASGFFVLARLSGEDSVNLEVSPFRETDGPIGGTYAMQRAETTLSGRLGEWIVLGGHSEDETAATEDILRRHGTASRDDSWILVKVELAP